MNNYIHIAVISDEPYAIASVVMLTSAKLHKAPTSSYHIHVLSNEMSQFSKRKFMELQSDDFLIDWRECDAHQYDSIPMSSTLSTSVMLKCDVAEIMSDLDRLLLLDGDIIVKRDLTELWETKLGSNHLLAACADIDGNLGLKYNEMVGVECYFNTGVLILNLKMMREEGIGRKIVETKLQAPSTWVCPEQDPYNKVCERRWTHLSPKWNLTIPLLKLHDYDIETINKFYGTQYVSYAELEDDAGILHFCCFKPWRSRLLDYSPLWQKYHISSPYGGTSLIHEPNYPFIRTQTTTCIKLFDVLPFLYTKEDEARKDCFIFGCLRLYKIKKRNNVRKFLLFGFLPIYSYRIYNKKVR